MNLDIELRDPGEPFNIEEVSKEETSWVVWVVDDEPQ